MHRIGRHPEAELTMTARCLASTCGQSRRTGPRVKRQALAVTLGAVLWIVTVALMARRF